MHKEIFNCSIGNIEIKHETSVLFNLNFSNEPANSSLSEFAIYIKREIDEYLLGQRKEFTIPYKLIGTPFQILVWNRLIKIPYGEITSYKYVAESIAKPKAYRAVGNANNKNPIAIIIPCHRVIAHNGDLQGYAGGIGIKESLLKIEKAKAF